MRVFGLTDPGLIRDTNEDAFLVSEEQNLFIVSDGMGGTRAGGLASKMTVQTMPLQVSAESLARQVQAEDTIKQAYEDVLVNAIAFINDMLLDKTRDFPEVKGMGATIVAVFYLGNGAMALANLGDSRAYLMRDGYIERLTNDHNMAEMLFKTGHINRQQKRRHPGRHILTHYIGMEDCPPADTAILLLEPEDRLLLCTDGLTGMLNDREIGRILWQTKNRTAACHKLIDYANKAGGHDNITAVIVDVEAPERPVTKKSRREKVVVRRKIGRSLKTEESLNKSKEKTLNRI